jgi:mono/diheme cytochrome c family protein
MRSTRWLAVAALVAAAGCGRGDGQEEPVLDPPREEEAGPPPGELPAGATAEQAAEGRRLYAVACVMCHGERAEGTQLGPPLAEGAWTHGSGSLEDIARVVEEGAPATDEYGVPMPPRGNGTFTDEQVRAVSTYVFSLSRARTAPPADTVAADG